MVLYIIHFIFSHEQTGVDAWCMLACGFLLFKEDDIS